MRWSKTLTLVEAHAEGEVGRVVTGGLIDIPGQTMLDKMNYINELDDSLRRFCVMEPRGSAQMSTILMPQSPNPLADAGMIVLQGDRAHAMSGSNCICTVTVLLETGRVAMSEPETIVRLDTPAGLVIARARCHDGKCESVTLEMVPGFVEALDVAVDVPGVGRIMVDLAFGGIYYALIDPKDFGLRIRPDNARALVDMGCRVHRALNEQIDVRHPTMPSIDNIAYTMFVDVNDVGELHGVTILPPGRVDRSPCGTGNTARLAVRHGRGTAKVGERTIARSIIDSNFEIFFAGETMVGDRGAVQAEITGRAWIHGIHQIGLDPADPYPAGFMLSDCWGDAFDLVG
ncbi:MAG: proline racemase family protein [Alphaproteobacteria bacterium]